MKTPRLVHLAEDRHEPPLTVAAGHCHELLRMAVPVSRYSDQRGCRQQVTNKVNGTSVVWAIDVHRQYVNTMSIGSSQC